MDRAIRHNPEKQRFEWIEDGLLCVLDYTLNDTLMTITYTGVPAAVGGRGIAAQLTRHALDTAQTLGWKVRPVCSYAVAYMQQHPEYGKLKA